MAEKRARITRTITPNVAGFEELVSVKRSIYPWDDLIPQEDDDPKKAARNFFVDCDDADAARALKSSVNSSGLNYFLKRRINLIPILQVGNLNGTAGILCMAASVE